MLWRVWRWFIGGRLDDFRELRRQEQARRAIRRAATQPEER